MIQINRDGALVKWAYLHPGSLAMWIIGRGWDTDPVPHVTTVCAIFWRSALLAPPTFLFGVVGAVVFVPVYYLCLGIGRLVKTVATPSRRDRIADFMEARWDRFDASRMASALLRAKQRMCPMVSIEQRQPAASDKEATL